MEPIPFRGAADIYALLREEAATWDRERFVTLILDNKHRLIGVEEVSVGTLTSTLVHPREMLKVLILANAAAFTVAHNLCAASHKLCYVASRFMCSEPEGVAAIDGLVGREWVGAPHKNGPAFQDRRHPRVPAKAVA